MLAMNAESKPEYRFYRPTIIVAAPRSGSTLLFETMRHSRSLWTIGDESHMVFEHLKKLDPRHGICSSNRLVARDADDETVERIREVFFEHLRDSSDRPYGELDVDTAPAPRFLEKTPKNSLRIPFLNEVFPDARYIYLFRDPRENLSSIIEAWRSSDFVTYSGLPGWPGQWSFLLPPGFEHLWGTSLEEVVAFQWRAANQFILDDLRAIPADRWTAVSYAELITDTTATIRRLCDFADIPFDEDLREHCNRQLPLSRYTKTDPKNGKWRRNEIIIEQVMSDLRPVIERIAVDVSPYTSSPVLTTGPIRDGAVVAQPPRMGRNETCYCGSQLRYKHCHGNVHATNGVTGLTQ